MRRYHYPIDYKGLRIARDVLPFELDEYGYVFSLADRYVAVHDKGQMKTRQGRAAMLARVRYALDHFGADRADA